MGGVVGSKVYLQLWGKSCLCCLEKRNTIYINACDALYIEQEKKSTVMFAYTKPKLQFNGIKHLKIHYAFASSIYQCESKVLHL